MPDHDRNDRDTLIQLAVGATAQLDSTLSQLLVTAIQTLHADWSEEKAARESLVEQVEALYHDQATPRAAPLSDTEAHLVEQLEALYAEKQETEATQAQLVAQLEALYAEKAEGGSRRSRQPRRRASWAASAAE